MLCAAVAGALAGAAPAAATLPGANGRIAFESYDANFNTTLVSVNPSVRRSRVRLTRVPRQCLKKDPEVYWSDEKPRWSPDGNWIAYTHEDDCRDRTAFQRQVRLIRPDGRGMRILRRFDYGTPAYSDDSLHPVFLPGGTRLAFSAGDGHAWVIGARSGRLVRRTRLPEVRLSVPDLGYSTFDWSAGGRVALTLRPRRIRRTRPNRLQGVGLFAGRLGACYRRLNLTPQRRDSVRLDVSADWHPYDGRLIFERIGLCLTDTKCPFDPELGDSDIYLVSSQGRTRRLTRGGYSAEPVFSPDGRSFAYVTGAPICVRRIGARRDRWCGAPDGASPAWQPVTSATRYF